MQNVDIQVKNGKAVITIDLAVRGALSQSRKNVLVASTGGNQPIGDTGVVLGLNAYTKPDAS